MKLNNAIGIDPDSKGCVCTFVKTNQRRNENKEFLFTKSGETKFINWVKSKGDALVGIEGLNGQSKPLEDALRKNNITYYSFAPFKVERFRESSLGIAKDNILDAEATARLAMSMQAQGLLENSKCTWEVDEDLRCLTRSCQGSSESLTAEINLLWKLIKKASVDLYLYLGGNHDEVEQRSNIIKNKGILTLLMKKPDISEWQNMDEEELADFLGKRNFKHYKNLIKLSKSFSKTTPSIALTIKHSTTKILLLKEQKKELESMIAKKSKDNIFVQKISEIRGIGVTTAATIVTEIVDPRRFLNDGRLASYSGLARVLNSTGDETKGKKTKKNTFYNRRLKNAFFNAARTYVLFNRDSHLAMYFKYLLKRKMSITEARKRVARALLRKIFKILKGAVYENKNRDDMATGSMS